MGGLDPADGRLFGLLFLHRHPGRDPRLNWFVTPIRYRDILPIRASAYIISVFNEQIGKGAMAYYLNRRDRVPGWEVGS